MNSSLTLVPVSQRRKAGAVTGGFAVLLGIIGALPWTITTDGALHMLSIPPLAAGAFLGLVSWGMFRSAAIDVSERAFDEAIKSVIADAEIPCGCGHAHDPDQLDFADEPAHGQVPVVHHTGRTNQASACTQECTGSQSPACASCMLSAG